MTAPNLGGPTGKMSLTLLRPPGITMSNPSPEHTTNAAHSSPTPEYERDVVEEIAHSAPLILPLVGGVLMFLLAFIAVYMA